MFDKTYFDELTNLIDVYHRNYVVGPLSVQVVTTHGSFFLAGRPLAANANIVTLPYYDERRSKSAPNRGDPDRRPRRVPPSASLPYEHIIAVYLLPTVPKEDLEACDVADERSIGFPSDLPVAAR